MSASVRLSLKAARDLIRGYSGGTWEELRSAIAKAERASATKRKLRKPKAEKKAAKREETAAIRAAVVERAGNRCEDCGFGWGDGLELDHFFGRAKEPQSVSNCWVLCKLCHSAKTRSVGGSVSWLKHFAHHCDKHGYTAEAQRARNRLAFVQARGGT